MPVAAIVPVARYSACVIEHIWEQQVEGVCGLVPIAAVVLVASIMPVARYSACVIV